MQKYAEFALLQKCVKFAIRVLLVLHIEIKRHNCAVSAAQLRWNALTALLVFIAFAEEQRNVEGHLGGGLLFGFSGRFYG